MFNLVGLQQTMALPSRAYFRW